MKPFVRQLSKSQYCKGKNCLKSIWLYNFEKRFADSPSEFQAILFRQGNEVGDLARRYFGNGEFIDEDYKKPDEAIEHTKKAIADVNIKYIYEAALQFEDCLVRVDVLQRNEDDSFDLIEVKSTNSAKKHHLDDVAIQKFVAEKSGLKIRNAHLMHLNRNYIRIGDLSLNQLFEIDNVSTEIEGPLKEVPNYLEQIRATLKLKKAPKISIGSQCSNPYDCEFKGHCWEDVDHLSIHKLPRITDKKRSLLIKQNVLTMDKVPKDFDLSVPQLAHVLAAKKNEAIVGNESIEQHLDALNYPLYFLDFEAVSYAIPRFNNTSPYTQIPFQYSLHIKNSPDSKVTHKEFLHTTDTDPRRALAEQLCSEIENNGGSVIVYHAQFERMILKDLGNLFVDLEENLSDMVSRLWDLEEPFAKRHYCHPLFGGSSSIKVVLPVFCPSLSYADLEIQKGDVAAKIYMEMVQGRGDQSGAVSALKEYCKRDTIAMVEILSELMKAINFKAVA